MQVNQLTTINHQRQITPTREVSGCATHQVADTLANALWRLMWLQKNRLGQVLDRHDLDIPSFMTLMHLAHAADGATIGRLAQELSQPNPTMTGIVDRLHDKRLVIRKYGSLPDRRRVTVTLTARGRTLLNRIKEAQRAYIRRALSGMPSEDVERFIALLGLYLQELEKAE